MSSPTRPQRRPPDRAGYAHPPAVYRRRRIVLVVVLCLVVWGAVKLFPGGEGDSDAAPASARTSGKPTDPTSSPTQEPSSVPKENGIVPVNLPAPKAKCDPSTVRTTPSVEPGTYAGGAVVIRLTFSTTGTEACTLDVGKKDLLLQVSSGDDPVWTGAKCGEVSIDSLVLQPSWGTATEVSWNGRESSKGCDGAGDYVEPGKYSVRSALLGGEPGQAAMTLEERPEPKKPKKKSDKDKKSASENRADKKNGQDG